MKRAEISKRVGWDPRFVTWPESKVEIEAATPEQRLEWVRFLPVADTDARQELIAHVCSVQRAMGEW